MDSQAPRDLSGVNASQPWEMSKPLKARIMLQLWEVSVGMMALGVMPSRGDGMGTNTLSTAPVSTSTA